MNVSVIGLGAMGAAIAARLLDTGHDTAVWNRSAHRAEPLIAKGATGGTLAEVIAASDVLIVTLLRYNSVEEVLAPVFGELAGRTVVNLTSGTPNEARALAALLASHGVRYVDGGMMAVPEMIGRPGASILYSGDEAAFEEARPVLAELASAEFFPGDAGRASLVDLSLLAGMYGMFGGIAQATAMAERAGLPPTVFAPRLTAWLQAMATQAAGHAVVAEKRDYTTDTQSVSFNLGALEAIMEAARDEGVGDGFLAPVRDALAARAAAGRGEDVFASVIEAVRAQDAA
ncbi:6-phosphogluconate dehydrogenase [Actinorhabdospora filicis]|uniref:6-phosphogluconate dehydrogenase n=1 Tax=Actinorhabdospora filicis TaxID=1785913 RepID=A0A9W6SR65_9ACTN|nr:NAD(P)-binding domain-containing protein [Actinorhabdospora filicis]GLZ81445.1 6-phosphogluconate dehydrogenase [Actinorhabdospora filicis]